MTTREHLRTSDPDAALDLLRGIYRGFELTVPASSSYSCDLSVVGDERFSLVSVDQRSSGRAALEAQTAFVVGESALPVRVSAGRRVLDTTQPYLHPVAPAEAVWEARLLLNATQLEERPVRELLAQHYGRDDLPVRFGGTAPVSPERARLWSAASAHARAVAADPEMFSSELVRDALFRSLTAALVSAFPSDLLDLPAARDGATATPAAVRRAIAYMEEHLADPISVADIAEAARLSARGLQEAFRRVLGDTPTHYLRRMRLDAARADLQRRERTDGATVAQIARRWGFSHLPRFATYYRETFGESPRDTLDT